MVFRCHYQHSVFYSPAILPDALGIFQNVNTLDVFGLYRNKLLVGNLRTVEDDERVFVVAVVFRFHKLRIGSRDVIVFFRRSDVFLLYNDLSLVFILLFVCCGYGFGNQWLK